MHAKHKIAGILAAAAAVAAVPAAAGASPGQMIIKPTDPAVAQIAQYEQNPWTCSPMIEASGDGRVSSKFTWGPGGIGTFDIQVTATARKCNGVTHTAFAPYWTVTGPSDRYVGLFVQTAGKNNKWLNGCVKVYNSSKKNCVFIFKVGSGPRVGARELDTVRSTPGANRVTKIRLVAGAVQGDSWTGQWIAGGASDQFNLSRYSKVG
jgi:hypothetical protein